jgi:hypothetical protein
VIIEGTLEVDRIDDDGDLYAAKVWPADYEEDHSVVAVELTSVLGEDWWAAHADDASLLSGFGGTDKAKVAEQHPAWLRDLVSKRVRITIEEVT